MERRERENEESRNLEVMLKSDLERVHSERYEDQMSYLRGIRINPLSLLRVARIDPLFTQRGNNGFS